MTLKMIIIKIGLGVLGRNPTELLEALLYTVFFLNLVVIFDKMATAVFNQE